MFTLPLKTQRIDVLSHWCVYWLLLVGLPFTCCHTYTLHSVLYQHWSLQEAHNLWEVILHVNTSWKKMWGKTKEGRLVPPFYKIRTFDVFTLKALMKTTESPPSWRRKKKKSTQFRSQFLTWLVHLNSKDSLSTCGKEMASRTHVSFGIAHSSLYFC